MTVLNLFQLLHGSGSAREELAGEPDVLDGPERGKPLDRVQLPGSSESPAHPPG